MTSSSNAIIARVMLPDDANPAGNVHGGTILRLMEEAGMIAATRYVAGSGAIGVLVRFERMAFHQPVFVGEVASLSAQVIFTSVRSILVQVKVTAENLTKGETRVTNSGELWYVPLKKKDGNKDWKDPQRIQVPPFVPDADNPKAKAIYEKAKKIYDARKQEEENKQESANECLHIPDCLCPMCRANYKAPENARTPAQSRQSLSQVVLPGDCHAAGIAAGGFIMKLMDNAAGCSAFRHCRTNVVTVAVNAMDLVATVHLGCICTIQSQVVFCSKKTLEIQVTASTTSIHSIDDKTDELVAKGRYIFCALSPQGKSIPVPSLKLETNEDFVRAFAGQVRYQNSKKARESGT